MRLNKIVQEAATRSRSIDEVTPQEISSFIQNSCSQYLRVIKGITPFYRGMSRESTGDRPAGIMSVRKDRRSRGMDQETADYINNMLMNNGHARRDRSVITSPDYQHARGFGGLTFMVFPLNKLKKYTWVETKDMNMSDDRTGWTLDTPEAWYSEEAIPDDLKFTFEPEDNQIVLDKLYKDFEDYFHTNGNIKTAHNKGFETWWECREFLYLDIDYYDWDKNKQEVVSGKYYKDITREKEMEELDQSYNARELYDLLRR